MNTQQTAVDHTLANVGDGTVTLPAHMREFVNDQGNVLQAKEYIQRKLGVPVNRKQKISDLIKAGGDKAKALRKSFNAARPVIAKAHAKAWALAGADATMKKSVKFVFNSKGVFIGLDGKARFVKTSVDVEALVDQNASLLARIAELEKALPAKA